MRFLSTLAVVSLLIAGCGGGGANDAPKDTRQPALGKSGEQEEAAQELGFPGFATKNTTRIGGADPVADAAAAALAVYPSRSRETRPDAVVMVDRNDWRAAVSAAQLMSRPLGAPILFSDRDSVPPASQKALDQLKPTGAPQAGRAQIIRVGAAAVPEGYRVTDIEGTGFAELAKAIDSVRSAAAGRAATGRAVVVAPAGAPEYAMPAANYAAKSGTPVLWTEKDTLPAATRQAITARGRARIYVLGPESVISKAVEERLKGLGDVRRVSGPDPVQNAIAFARFSDGGFGWNVVDPGHGLLFASTRRPLDAPASAPLSASGTYGPLLLLEDPEVLPAPLQGYLLDVQPGYEADPVRAVYNHAWLMGDEQAISIDVQAQIDALLEVQPVDQGS
jgi:hypothetical protein